MKIVVLGYIVRFPLGGMAWHHFQYVLSLKQMGHEVLFLEDNDGPNSCYHPDKYELNNDPAYGLQFVQDLFSAFDLNSHWAYFDPFTNIWYGQSQQQVLFFCSRADVVLNISHVNPLRDWWAKIPCRVLIDTDPAFTQIKNLSNPGLHYLASQHTHFLSFGENIGRHNCTVPKDGFNWKPTRQPVFMPAWEKSPELAPSKWTTVMQWDSYRDRQFGGEVFGMKSLSFTGYITLPDCLPDDTFELALGSENAPVENLKCNGWHIVSSIVPTKNPWTYQEYIKTSKGEWSIAKHGYVKTNSGWFSERSTAYLASGRPVVVQDTGFSNFLPTQAGLLCFTTLDEAIDRINRVNTDYRFHCKKAREVVEEYFDGTKVLTEIIKNIA